MSKQIYVAFAVVIGLLLIIKSCESPPPKPGELKRDDISHVVVTKKGVTVTKRDKTGKVVSQTKTKVRRADITTKSNGDVVVKNRLVGLCFDPGIMLAQSDRFRVGLTAQFIYFGDFGVEAAVLATPSGRLSLSAALGLIYNFYGSTSVFLGMDTRQYPVVGLSIKF